MRNTLYKLGWPVEPLVQHTAVLETGSRPRGGVSKYTEGIPSISAEQISEEGMFKWDNIKYVPIGTTFKPDMNKRNNRRVRIGYIGSLTQSKGIEDLVNAANIVLKKYENIEFKIAGSWRKQEEEIKNRILYFINKNKINNNIELLGFISDDEKESFFLGIDIFAFPSWDEGQPLVILEAMAAGCPVIATEDVGAIPDTVIDGETGILVEKQNPEEIAKAIVYLIKNPGTRAKMGRAARKRFEENYTIGKNIDNMIRVFKQF